MDGRLWLHFRMNIHKHNVPSKYIGKFLICLAFSSICTVCQMGAPASTLPGLGEPAPTLEPSPS
jgi:hypothetical protein